MKSMVVYPSKPRKILSFSPQKLITLTFCVSIQPRRTSRFMQQKVPNQRKLVKQLVSIANFTPTSEFSTTDIKMELTVYPQQSS